MWFIVLIVCALMAFSLFMLAYTPKKLYKVCYLQIGFCRKELTVFLRARNLADIQKQLDKREAPCDVVILSVEIV
jgi:hypothetical protein